MESLKSFLAVDLELLPYLIISLLVAFTVHEFTHAYIAYKFGDPTAKNEGRLTLNPMVHLDVLGTIMIFFAGFGWAKPVPVNYFYFRKRKLAGILVSLGGPLSNLLVAFITVGIWVGLYNYGLFLTPEQNSGIFLTQLFNILVSLNISLFIFNLLPIPPLDGYRIIEDLVPNNLRPKLILWEQYGVFIFLLLLITPLGDYLFDPIFNTLHPLVGDSMFNFFYYIYGIK